MNTKWEGLWAQERPAFYAGKVIKKEDIPAYTRIVLRYNKFYEKGSNKPKFIYCFSDSKSYQQKCKNLEIEDEYEDEPVERLYTEAEVRKIINGTCAAKDYGISDPYDILPSDFV